MGSDRYLQPGWFSNAVGAQPPRRGGGTLRLGRRSEPFRATELPDSEKVPVLRAYLERWKLEVGVFFDGVGADSDDTELERIAPDHPVFRIDSTAT